LVFGIDIETCPACGGMVRIIACIEDPVVDPGLLLYLQRELGLEMAALEEMLSHHSG
jgi:hypothetical protein